MKWALIALLVLCLCCACGFGITRGPSVRLMCRVSGSVCEGFCRSAPELCREWNLPPAR